MTFFANSGVRFPDLDAATREVGADTLSAASDLWRFFSIIERDSYEGAERTEAEFVARQCGNALRKSSANYIVIANRTPDERPAPLTPIELEMIGSHRLFRPDFLFPVPFPRPDYSRRSIKDLYGELGRRLSLLADMLESLVPIRDRVASAPSVFAIMQEWEYVAVLARLIAVINRRRSGEMALEPTP